MRIRVILIIILSVLVSNCTSKYFTPLKINEYRLNTEIKENELIKMTKVDRVYKEDPYIHYTYKDSLQLKNKKYAIRYNLSLYKGRLKSYFFAIEGNPELYYEIVKEVSKGKVFEIDSNKIKYRYFLKAGKEDIYLHYRPNLVPVIGDIIGGKELPK
ncbi:hypothetical protein ACI6PS_09385 [Flavobacterium sp. PLA-1-15]|uniref:hypothetical protein n=1 Tax=Flavobacterium sp. PLA-1-15 TaxID=3380533 RepID=UPI003B8248A7